ncbi:MAG: hypothetical protein J1F38_09210 [Muribaculaceae bacterium]|nr:hypothetical protein [Muribaculaceae bacterium]
MKIFERAKQEAKEASDKLPGARGAGRREGVSAMVGKVFGGNIKKP